MSARSAVPLVVPTAAPTQPLCAGRVVIDGQDFGYVHVADALAGELASDEAAMAASVSLESPLKSRGSSLANSDLIGRLSAAASQHGGSDRDDDDDDDDDRDARKQSLAASSATTATMMTNWDSDTQASSGRQGGVAATGVVSSSSTSNLAVLLQLFCDTSVDATFIVSEVGAIITMNAAALDLFQYKRWEVVGRNVAMLMEPKFAKMHDSFLARYKRARVRRIIGETRDGLFAMRKDGSLFRVLLKVHEYRDQQQVVYIGIIRDVSTANQAGDYHALLAKLVPPTIAQRLIAGEAAIADRYRATVGFVDICGYTKRTRSMAPSQIVLMLAEIFAQFDAHLDEFSCTRIKTIGDGYMFTSNLTSQISAHAVNGALFAKRCLDSLAAASDTILKKSFQKDAAPISARAGVATGDVIAGVVPGKHMAFDLWGEAVNLAARLESSAPVNRVLVCKRTRDESHYCLVYAADPLQLNLKGIGEYDAFLLNDADEAHAGGGQPLSSKTKKTTRIRAKSSSAVAPATDEN